jgi:hypothetical protein
MPYEIRVENDVFNVYENDELLGILSCPFEQTAEEFIEEMNEAGYVLINRDEIVNIGDFHDAQELQMWDVFAIDPGDDLDEEEGEEAEA